MLESFLKRKILPKTSSGWADIHKRLADDKSAGNLIDQATRILCTYVFNPDPDDRLETSMIHKLAGCTDDFNEIVVMSFKTAKMYSACMRDQHLLYGLYNFGLVNGLDMKYTFHDYVYDDYAGSLILDANGVIREKRDAAAKKYMEGVLKQSKGDNPKEVKKPGITLENPPENVDDATADELIRQWEQKLRDNNNNN